MQFLAHMLSWKTWLHFTNAEVAKSPSVDCLVMITRRVGQNYGTHPCNTTNPNVETWIMNGTHCLAYHWCCHQMEAKQTEGTCWSRQRTFRVLQITARNGITLSKNSEYLNWYLQKVEHLTNRKAIRTKVWHNCDNLQVLRIKVADVHTGLSQ